MEGVLCVEVLSYIVYGQHKTRSVDIGIVCGVHLGCGTYEWNCYGVVAVTQYDQFLFRTFKYHYRVYLN